MVVFSAGFLTFESVKYRMVGNLSTAQATGAMLGGYPNHEAFKHECGHCHVPIHCISDDRCQNCHLEIARERMEQDGLHSKLPGTYKCQTCHTEHQGTDANISYVPFVNINHQELGGFSLEKHNLRVDNSLMTCEDCHTQGNFAEGSTDCVTCHVEMDHDFTSAHMDFYGVNCLACHDGTANMAEFAHDTYVLDGAHAGAECASCHQNQVFQGTSQVCSDCHIAEKDKVMFGAACNRCHTTTAWKPAYLLLHTFDIRHGSDDVVACETCHQQYYTEITCYGCHDHQPVETIAEHFAVGEYGDLSDCASCHPTGAAGEAAALKTAVQSGR